MGLGEEIANESKDIQDQLKKDLDIILDGPTIDVVLRKIVSIIFLIFCIFPFSIVSLILQSSDNK